MSEQADCIEALKLYAISLGGFQNVKGLGIGEELKSGEPTGRCAVKVYVTKKFAVGELREDEVLPDTLDLLHNDTNKKVPVDVVEQGELELE